MRERGKASVADVHHNEISGNRVERDRNGALVTKRHILGDAVLRCDDGAVRDGQHFLSVGEPVLVAGAIVVREPYSAGSPDGGVYLIATFADPDDNYFQLQTPYRPSE